LVANVLLLYHRALQTLAQLVGKANSTPSPDEEYTVPPVTAGDVKALFPVLLVQSGEQTAFPVPHDARNACTWRPSDPTYTTPPVTAGDELTMPPVAPCHSGVHGFAHEVGYAYRLPS
jgi:hypothetical protein